MTGEVGGGERVRNQYEDYQKIRDHLAGLFDRASKLDPVTLKANGITVVAGDDEQVASMGPELACVNPQDGVIYYARFIDGVEPTIHMSMSKQVIEEGSYDELVLEAKVGASWGDIDVANDLLEQFESAISKAEQPQQSRGGRLAGLLERWRRLKDQALDGIEAVMKELDS